MKTVKTWRDGASRDEGIIGSIRSEIV